MAVTVEMIASKEFKVVSKGYDPSEVDDFLNDICEEMEGLEDDIKQLRSALTKAEATPAPVVAAPAPREDSSEAAQRLLKNAQRVSDETIADAKAEADKIIAEAKAKADKMLQNTKTESARLTSSLDTLRAAANDYRARFKRLVDDQSHLLNAETELFK